MSSTLAGREPHWRSRGFWGRGCRSNRQRRCRGWGIGEAGRGGGGDCGRRCGGGGRGTAGVEYCVGVDVDLPRGFEGVPGLANGVWEDRGAFGGHGDIAVHEQQAEDEPLGPASFNGAASGELETVEDAGGGGLEDRGVSRRAAASAETSWRSMLPSREWMEAWRRVTLPATSRVQLRSRRNRR